MIHGMLKTDETLEERTVLSSGRIVDWCLRSTYFSYNDTFYEQKEGAAMVSPVVVANLYMEYFEQIYSHRVVLCKTWDME